MSSYATGLGIQRHTNGEPNLTIGAGYGTYSSMPKETEIGGSNDSKKDRRIAKAKARSRSVEVGIKPELLARAKELLTGLDVTDQLSLTVNLSEVGTTVAALWESAGKTTPIHKMILAALDSAILSALAADFISADQISVFLEALGDLSMETVTEVQAEAIRSRLIDLGKKPLFIIADAD
jgi:hypothetical protein